MRIGPIWLGNLGAHTYAQRKQSRFGGKLVDSRRARARQSACSAHARLHASHARAHTCMAGYTPGRLACVRARARACAASRCAARVTSYQCACAAVRARVSLSLSLSLSLCGSRSQGIAIGDGAFDPPNQFVGFGQLLFDLGMASRA
eukprot:1466296-Pleurochrysis_carterae.AAC.1